MSNAADMAGMEAAPSGGGAMSWLEATIARGWSRPSPMQDRTLPDFLAAARTLFLSFIAAFPDTPGDYAVHPGIWRWLMRERLRWVRPLERLARRIVLIEALALLVNQMLPRRSAKARKPEAKRKASPRKPWDRTSEPETWSVSFRTVTSRRIDRRIRKRKKWPTEHEQLLMPEGSDFIGKNGEFARVLLDAGPLARRLEALRRVLVDPAKTARRLAWRFARVKREAVVLTLSPPRGPRNLPLGTDVTEAADRRCIELASGWFGSG